MWEMIAILAHTVFVIFKGAMKNLRVWPLMQPNLIGIPYHHYFGHRGFLHSLFFALILSLIVTAVFFRGEKLFSGRWFFYIVFFFLLTASHGILDAFTNGGLGIALFSPLSNERYVFPWTPIAVSPIGIAPFLSKRGWFVLKSELLWVWLPVSIIAVVLTAIRKVLVRIW